MPLTVEEAVSRALAASHRIDEAAARRGHRGRQRRPPRRHAAASGHLAGYTRTPTTWSRSAYRWPNNQFDLIYPDIPNNYRTRLDVQWPIYTGGRLDALAAAARRRPTPPATDIEAAALDLRLEVTRAFWNWSSRRRIRSRPR